MIHSYDEDRINFFHTDEHARKATKADAQTMDDLIDYLNEPFKDSPDRELHLARGILVWVQSNMDFKGNTGHTSPLGYVQTMAQRRLSPAEAFKLFFDAADIECEVITGRAKAIRYRAGETDLATDSWLTFKAAGKMHWFHPGWAIQKIEGFKHSDERRLELDGQFLNDRSTSSTGTCMHSLNDFWFCLSPDIFKTRCHAHMKDFISLQTFLTSPDLRQAFYVHRLSLLGCNENKIQAKHGKCTISLLADRESAMSVDLSYELIKHTGLHVLDMDDEEDFADFQQLVLHSVRKRTLHVFEVRLPFKGEYWLRIYAGNVDASEPKRKCIEFKIISNDNNKDIKKYPTSCGLGVFGLSPKAEKAGLSNPSVSGAKLFVEAKSHEPWVPKKTLVTFHLDEENASREYESELHADDLEKSSDFLDDCIETSKDTDLGTITVKGRVPEKGEYSLVINALGDSVPGKITKEAVACYLVTTEEKGSSEIIEWEIKQEEKSKRKEIKREKKQLLKENITKELDSLQKEIAEIKEEIGTITTFTKLQRELITQNTFADTCTKPFPRITVETIGDQVIFDGPIEDADAANIRVGESDNMPMTMHIPDELKISLSKDQKVRLIPFFALVIVYFMLMPLFHYQPENLGSVIFKVLPIIALAQFVALSDKPIAYIPKSLEELLPEDHQSLYFFIALLFSALGDAFLAWRHFFFILGVVAFATGHVFYLFGLRVPKKGTHTSRTRDLFILLALSVFLFITNFVDSYIMTVLVGAYVVLISLIGWRASAQFEIKTTKPALYGLLGALLFMLSDFFIAVDMWILTVSFSSCLINSTYYAAQLCLALSTLRVKND